MRIFSSLVIDAPGLCSPSRNVVSNMIRWSAMVRSPGRVSRAVQASLPAVGPTGHGYCERGIVLSARGAQQKQQQAARREVGAGSAETAGDADAVHCDRTITAISPAQQGAGKDDLRRAPRALRRRRGLRRRRTHPRPRRSDVARQRIARRTGEQHDRRLIRTSSAITSTKTKIARNGTLFRRLMS